jgi:hypothetical protein
LLGLVAASGSQQGAEGSVKALLGVMSGAGLESDTQQHQQHHRQEGVLPPTADALQQAADIVTPAASTLTNLLKHRTVLPEELSGKGVEGLAHQVLQVASQGLQILIRPSLSDMHTMSEQHIRWQVAQLSQIEACSRAVSVAGRSAEATSDPKSNVWACMLGGATALAGMLSELVPVLVSGSGIARVSDSTAGKAAQGAVHSGAAALAVLLAKGHVSPAGVYHLVLPAVKAGLKGSDSAPKDLSSDMLRLLHLLMLNTKLASVAAKDSELVVALKQLRRGAGGEVAGTAKQVLSLLDRHDKYGYIVPRSKREEADA